MTLKAAWITPAGPRGPFTLTLESAEVGPGHQLPVREMVFPETPVDAPKRHTVLLSALTVEDLDLIGRLIETARTIDGRTYEQTTVRLEEDDFPLETP